MPMYMRDSKQIGFSDDGDDDNWVRADHYETGVGFDRAGLHKLGAAECRQLAEWLLEIASELLIQDERGVAKPARQRKEKRRTRLFGGQQKKSRGAA